jgi:hypothetical protein
MITTLEKGQIHAAVTRMKMTITHLTNLTHELKISDEPQNLAMIQQVLTKQQQLVDDLLALEVEWRMRS